MGQKSGLVLCVDDEPGILRSLQWLLQKEFDVVTAPSGELGLALVLQNSFDVVVSDQRMPGMTGSEFLREVRKVSPRALRILLTGYSDLQAILRSVNEGEVFRFINKPWNIAELPRIVGEAAAIARYKPEREVIVTNPESPQIKSGAEQILLIDDDPSVAVMLREAVGTSMRILHATNLADAIEFLVSENISVIVSDLRVDNTDTTRLLKMLKRKHPQVVAVVISAVKDAAELVSLINQGQIYRFVPKPIEVDYLKIVIQSALDKHIQIADNPDILKRHIVEGIATDVENGLMVDVQHAARRKSAGARQSDGGASLLQKVTHDFIRLFKA